MTPEQWLRLEELFEAAVDMTPQQRAEYLDQSCADDGELRRRVESLIVSASDEGGVIEAAIHGAARLAAEDKGGGGERIGPYRVERELGRGGMGAVYLAERADDEYHKRVAIKLIRSAIASSDLLRRFRSERQILANLDHPNIARLLDGGTTDSGAPYVVMEYVEGEPIDEYCDRNRLTTDDRLALFRKVCSAVQYAHQNLVVHRDIKPGNIIVTADGEPKLLDFGIAKLLKHDDSFAAIAETRADVRLMTPEYASPEQVRGEPITTASDVYSLGVVLYELLSGRRPHRFTTTKPSEVERIICEQEPDRPSTAVAHDNEAPERRRSTTDKLQRRLKGDLDNIVLTALRKEPSRRYPSVERFSDDIRRHLEGLPVLTRSSTLRYRAQKFVRRHRVGVAAAASVVVLVAALIGFYTWRLADERDRAQLEAAKAAQVSDFLTGLFQISDPIESKGETITARQLLDSGAARIEKELSNQPEVQAEMMNVISKVYRELGLFKQAKPLSERAVQLRRQFYGPNHARVAESLHQLSAVEHELGNYEGAEALARQALDISRSVRGNEHEDVGRDLELQAVVQYAKGDIKGAEEHRKQALEIYRRTIPADDPRIVAVLAGLADLEIRKGNYDAAESLLREVVDTERKRYGDDDARVAGHVFNLGEAQLAKGDYKSAELNFRQSLATARKVLGEEHPTVAIRLANAGFALAGSGQYEIGESYLRQALALNLKLRGEDSLHVANNLQNLATVMFRRGNLAEAEPLFRRALVVYRKTLGEDDDRMSTALTTLGSLLVEKGTYPEAERLIRQALEIDRKRWGEVHPYVADDLSRLARVLKEMGNLAESEQLYRRSVELERKLLPAADPNRTTGLIGLGAVLVLRGDPKSAEPLLREALDVQQKALPEGDWTVAVAKSELAACLTALRQYGEAERLLLESHPILVSAHGAQNKRTRLTRDRLVTLYKAWNKPDKAAQYVERQPGKGL